MPSIFYNGQMCFDGRRVLLKGRGMARKLRQTRIGLRTKIIGLLLSVLALSSAAFVSFTYIEQHDRMTEELLEKSRVLVMEMDAVWDFVSINQNTINYTAEGEYE